MAVANFFYEVNDMFSGHRRFAIIAIVIGIAFIFVLALATPAHAQDVVISQVYGAGGTTGAPYKNDFIELFNRGTAAVDLSTYSIQYASSTGSAWSRTNLGGFIQPGKYYLVQEAAGTVVSPALPTPDAVGTIFMSSSAGKVALVANQAPLTGTCPTGVVDLVGFGTAANCFEGTGPTATLSTITAAQRAGGGCIDSNNNAADFSTAAPNPRNSASSGTTCTVTTNPAIAFALSTPATADVGTTVTFTVKAVPGTNPTSTGLTVIADLTTIGGAASQSFFDDGSNGDAVSGDNVFTYQFATAGASPNTYTLPVTLRDAQWRAATGSISLTLNAPAPYYPIHAIQGNGNISPFNTQRVQTSGIVTSKASNGFYLQAPDSEADADPSTSEGIFVYSGSTPTVALQDAVQVTGTVSEYRPGSAVLTVTELISPSVTVTTHGSPLPAVTAISPQPSEPIEAPERYEGMLVQIATPKAVAPTWGVPVSDGIFYVIAPNVARPFREPGVEPGIALPSGMPANVPHFDGNVERVRVDASACNPRPLVTAGDTLPTITGALSYNYEYTLVANCPVTFSTAATAAPLPVRRDGEFTVSSFNMLNFTNDASRIAKASKAIRLVMREPDVIGVQEVDNLATLQAVAAKVNSEASDAPDYHAELLSTTGAQNVGFLYRGDRLTDVRVVEVGRTAMFTDPRDGSQDLTNDRPPLVMMAKIVPATGVPYPVTIMVNHLRSLNDVNTVGGTGDYARAKRKAGAEYLAGLLSQHQGVGETVISVGDYNAFEFNDGYVDVLGTVKGQPTPVDQVLLSSPDLVNPDMTDLVLTLPADLRYSYIDYGTAQTLDHILVSSALVNRPFHLEIAHNNADFPEALANDATRPERVSDHDMPVAYLSFPLPVRVEVNGGTIGTYGSAELRAAVVVNGVAPTGTVTFREGTTTLGTETPTNGIATLSMPEMAAGDHLIVAAYSGDANYSPTTSGATNVYVAPARLTIRADDFARLVGAANPEFTGTITGIQHNDAVSVTYSTTAAPSSVVGQYPIIPSAVAAASVLSNYAVNPVNGTLTIVGSDIVPETGWWWNSAQSGMAIFVERRGSHMFLAGLAYTAGGAPTWVLSIGSVTSSLYVGKVHEYRGGQTLTGPYQPAVDVGVQQTMTLQFLDSANAILTWYGQAIPLQRFGFTGAGASAPTGVIQNGWWWNTAESGRGFIVEVQGTSLFMAGLMYDAGGAPTWYLANGPMSSPMQFTGTWQQYGGGPTLLGCTPTPNPFFGARCFATVTNPNVGAVSITFTDASHGTMALPDGRQIPIERLVF